MIVYYNKYVIMYNTIHIENELTRISNKPLVHESRVARRKRCQTLHRFLKVVCFESRGRETMQPFNVHSTRFVAHVLNQPTRVGTAP